MSVRDYPTRARAAAAASKASGYLAEGDGIQLGESGLWYPVARLREDQEYLKVRIAERDVIVATASGSTLIQHEGRVLEMVGGERI